MIVTISQIKTTEEAAFRNGITSVGLMEVAGVGIAECIRQFFPREGILIVFCGKGHNAGDSLIAARQLSDWGWRIIIRLATPVSELAPLARAHLEALPADSISELPIKGITGCLVLLDGLLGIGSTGAPRGVIADRIAEMNQLRGINGAYSIAIDLPSGLNGTTGELFEPCIQADLTITIGMVKSGLIADTATSVVGRLALVPLPGLLCDKGDVAEVLTAKNLRALLPIRNFDSQKGTYGRIGILAGSRGYLGAARLATAASVHAGGGLVTLYAQRENYELLASLCIPEVMVQAVDSFLEVLLAKHDVLAIGPGMGRKHDEEILQIILESPLPCIVDADALNAIASDLSILSRCAGPRLLTPHPGEMERLFTAKGLSRRAWAEKFVTEYPVTLLLKGARTVIAEQDHPTSFNTTGNPGMGSGGMGDVLTGVCAALIGSGHTMRDAARIGAWICGRAAEIAIFNGNESQESLAATSVINHLGVAYGSLRRGNY